jgi:hypothetical protein
MTNLTTNMKLPCVCDLGVFAEEYFYFQNKVRNSIHERLRFRIAINSFAADLMLLKSFGFETEMHFFLL